jgi:hypothetical protein
MPYLQRDEALNYLSVLSKTGDSNGNHEIDIVKIQNSKILLDLSFL